MTSLPTSARHSSSPTATITTHGRVLGVFGLSLALSSVLPLPAAAMPIQALSAVSSSASSGGTTNGPRRPGVVQAPSVSSRPVADSARPQGPRRPVPATSDSLTAER